MQVAVSDCQGTFASAITGLLSGARGHLGAVVAASLVSVRVVAGGLPEVGLLAVQRAAQLRGLPSKLHRAHACPAPLVGLTARRAPGRGAALWQRPSQLWAGISGTLRSGGRMCAALQGRACGGNKSQDSGEDHERTSASLGYCVWFALVVGLVGRRGPCWG